MVPAKFVCKRRIQCDHFRVIHIDDFSFSTIQILYKYSHVVKKPNYTVQLIECSLDHSSYPLSSVIVTHWPTAIFPDIFLCKIDMYL